MPRDGQGYGGGASEAGDTVFRREGGFDGGGEREDFAGGIEEIAEEDGRVFGGVLWRVMEARTCKEVAGILIKPRQVCAAVGTPSRMRGNYDDMSGCRKSRDERYPLLQSSEGQVLLQEMRSFEWTILRRCNTRFYSCVDRDEIRGTMANQEEGGIISHKPEESTIPC